MQGAGFRVQGWGFGIQGSGFRVQDSGFRVKGEGVKVEGRECIHGTRHSRAGGLHLASGCATE